MASVSDVKTSYNLENAHQTMKQVKDKKRDKCLKIGLTFGILIGLVVFAIVLAVLITVMAQNNFNSVPNNNNNNGDCTTSEVVQPRVTAHDVNTIKADITEHIREKRQGGSLIRIAGFVRLAFHDCVGGCDGCIDLGNGENAGLGLYIEELDPVYSKYSNKLSRADFWQLAGIAALQESGRGCNNCIHPWVQFVAGRKDCSSSPKYDGPHRMFPNNGGHANIDDVLGFFNSTFGLSRSQPELAVALLGAHSLGRTHRGASGWDGPWDLTPDRLDQSYYSDMMRLNWTEVEISNNKHQWKPPIGNTMMLHADMCLHKVISPINTTTGQSACPFAQLCDNQPETSKFVQLFADDLEAWERNFQAAYYKMITTGYTNAELYVPA
ncbi:unnamed protein product [Owenia fusiformis]|uniref:Plant heme peroxidase family profile domain-containing protein n=1 Tax=Owenia fusiformis TaxID=6347 RepID=A0A8S4N3D8_OWEFU|nr:unnamed protein product [Owenia fusiformis]